MAVVIIPLGIIGWMFAPHIFLAWLGKYDETIIDVFRWLLVGITCAGLMWLPAAFQQAHGWTRLHVSMIAGALVLGVPAMVWSIKDIWDRRGHGGLGSARCFGYHFRIVAHAQAFVDWRAARLVSLGAAATSVGQPSLGRPLLVADAEWPEQVD